MPDKNRLRCLRRRPQAEHQYAGDPDDGFRLRSQPQHCPRQPGGLQAVLFKPFKVEQLLVEVRKALQRPRLNNYKKDSGKIPVSPASLLAVNTANYDA